MPCVGKQGDGMRRDTIENLNGYQPNTESSRNCEHRAEIFWGVNVSVSTVLVRVVTVVMIVFHHKGIAPDSRVTLSRVNLRASVNERGLSGQRCPLWVKSGH